LRRSVQAWQVHAAERARRRAGAGAATRDWSDLVAALESVAAASGTELVEAAEKRAIARIGRAILAEIDERHGALVRPIQESEQRVAVLVRQVAEAERAMEDMGVLLGAEQAKLARTFRERQERFLEPAQAAARDSFRERFAAVQVLKRRLRAAAFEVVRDLARAVSDRFRTELEPEAEELYRGAMDRFVALANEFLVGVARAPGMESIATVGPEVGFRVRGELRYTDLLYDTTATPLVWALDALLPRGAVVRAARRRAEAYLDRLVETNSSRIANDLVERAAASRSRLEAELRVRVREVSARANRAVSEARRRLQEGQPAVMMELSRLDALRRETEPLVAARSKGEGS
jgi:hypothetical protein